MVTQIWFNIGSASGNGLLPDGTKPLPEPMLLWKVFYSIHLRANSQVLMNLLLSVLWITLSNLLNLPRANEFKYEYGLFIVQKNMYVCVFCYLQVIQMVKNIKNQYQLMLESS